MLSAFLLYFDSYFRLGYPTMNAHLFSLYTPYIRMKPLQSAY